MILFLLIFLIKFYFFKIFRRHFASVGVALFVYLFFFIFLLILAIGTNMAAWQRVQKAAVGHSMVNWAQRRGQSVNSHTSVADQVPPVKILFFYFFSFFSDVGRQPNFLVLPQIRHGFVDCHYSCAAHCASVKMG